MDILEVLGYIGAFFVGLVLGLTGSGGSIITVPVMVYLLSVNPVTATAYSLFVVGVSSSIGAFQNYKRQLVNIRIAVVFAIPSFTAIFLTRRYLLPSIPDSLWTINGFEVTKDVFIMVLFAVIMAFAAISMIRSKSNVEDDDQRLTFNLPMIIVIAIVVGVLSGLVGAGGGFLIIPALVILAKTPMRIAVATSLVIVTINSLIGFLGDVFTTQLDWPFLLIFTGISIVGIITGVFLSKFISGSKLKKGFGIFVLFVAIFILFKELYNQM